MIITAAIGKIDLQLLLEARRELTALGNLVNQSLKLSWGESVNLSALESVVKKLGGLLG